MLDWLQRLAPEERAAVPGLNPARSDIIVAGLAVAAEVLARFDPRDLLVSGYGIREGLLLESARVMPVVADPGAARERSVREFAERCHYEVPHAQQVQRLALQLFDKLGAAAAAAPPWTGRSSPMPRCCTTWATTSTTRSTTSTRSTSSARRTAGHDAGGADRDRARGALSPRRGRPSASTAASRSSTACCARAS